MFRNNKDRQALRASAAAKAAAAEAAAKAAVEKAAAVEAAKAAFGKDFAPHRIRRPLNVKIDRLPQEKLVIRDFEPDAHAEMMKVGAGAAAKHPASVDLRAKMPPVFDQGQLGSCSAQALCAAYQYDVPKVAGSRLFLYYNERKLEGDIPDDNGAFIHDGIACLQKYGVCPESEWPYNIAKFAMAPPAKCYTDALPHKAVAAHNVQNTMAAMKNCLLGGFPFVVGISVYDSFESDQVAMTGIVPMPAADEDCLGGHAVVCVGFNDANQTWLMRNSWGTGWGQKGHFTLPYAYLLDSNMCSDLWVITAAK
jgi:C1A family cysteine protease